MTPEEYGRHLAEEHLASGWRPSEQQLEAAARILATVDEGAAA